MERISKTTIMPKRGETIENVMRFEDVFGVKFGAAGKIRQDIGDRNRRSENPGVICINFKTPNHTEVHVGFQIVMSAMAEVLIGKDWVLIISEQPWANKGDSGNLFEKFSDGINTYISSDGKDPEKGKMQTGYAAKPGGGYHMVTTPRPPRPDGGLKPNTDYYVTLRSPRSTGDILPINIVYFGTDDAEGGGEVEFALPPQIVVIPPPLIPPDQLPSGAIEITIAGVQGIWAPVVK